jgi:hypothetical protein
MMRAFSILRREVGGLVLGSFISLIGLIFLNPVMVYCGGGIAALHILRNIL